MYKVNVSSLKLSVCQERLYMEMGRKSTSADVTHESQPDWT
jgi:hypothetical protein